THSNLTITEWQNISNGMSIIGTYCGTLLRNKVRYVRHGFGVGYSGLNYPANSGSQLLDSNDLREFSGDSARMNSSDLIIRNNKFIDGYASVADGDPNHDDGIQGFKLDGGFYQNILIEGNYILDRTSSTRLFLTDYQGISIFDGLFKDVTIRKNILLVGAWHGISMYGVDGAVIENNTVLTTSGKSLWIGAFNSKQGVPPKNIVVKNNIATKIDNKLYTVDQNNYSVTNPQNHFVKFDVTNGQYDLHLKPSSPLYGKGAGAL
ncbi:MAG: right-handed parallel beta-helix repeat-containing protein, partial [Bdellovibrionales bacterium]|nr:right-handed parallel beta-helix repeat-containing protein [Bdellovibrionales bacterium]